MMPTEADLGLQRLSATLDAQGCYFFPGTGWIVGRVEAVGAMSVSGSQRHL